MNYEFKLPDIGEVIHEGTVLKWFVKVGEKRFKILAGNYS